MGALGSCCSKDSIIQGAGGTKLGHRQDDIQFQHAFALDNPGRLDDFYDIDQTNQLGMGSSGGVFKAIHKSTKVERALKSLFLDNCGADGGTEVNILRCLDHPNIIKLHEIFKDAKCIYLLMDICTGGDLFETVMEKSANVQFSEHRAATYAEQILSAVTYLHSHKIAHRDIRPDNILLQAPLAADPKAETKLIDFGLACRCNTGDPLTLQTGSASYMAPEMVEGRYDLKCDLWSCGVLFYIMICGSPPFDGADDREILSAVRFGKFKFPSHLWGNVSQCAKDFVTLLLTRDSSERPDAETLMKHDWLKRGDVKGKQPLPSVVARLKTFTQSRKLKKVCLTMIATQLPRSDIEDLRLYFKSLDKNGDGTISHKELLKGLEMQAKANKDMKREDLEKLVSIDTDGSGLIDYTEFIAAAIDKRTYQKRDVIWSAFRAFDLDGNGVIDRQELRKVMESSAGSVALPEAKIKALISEADKDGDGKIDFEEFMAMMIET